MRTAWLKVECTQRIIYIFHVGCLVIVRIVIWILLNYIISRNCKIEISMIGSIEHGGRRWNGDEGTTKFFLYRH